MFENFVDVDERTKGTTNLAMAEEGGFGVEKETDILGEFDFGDSEIWVGFKTTASGFGDGFDVADAELVLLERKNVGIKSEDDVFDEGEGAVIFGVAGEFGFGKIQRSEAIWTGADWFLVEGGVFQMVDGFGGEEVSGEKSDGGVAEEKGFGVSEDENEGVIVDDFDVNIVKGLGKGTLIGFIFQNCVESENDIIGGHRNSVMPSGFGIEIKGVIFLVGRERPLGGDVGNDVAFGGIEASESRKNEGTKIFVGGILGTKNGVGKARATNLGFAISASRSGSELGPFLGGDLGEERSGHDKKNECDSQNYFFCQGEVWIHAELKKSANHQGESGAHKTDGKEDGQSEDEFFGAALLRVNLGRTTKSEGHVSTALGGNNGEESQNGEDELDLSEHFLDD